jgi:hypothetical protein
LRGKTGGDETAASSLYRRARTRQPADRLIVANTRVDLLTAH